MSIRVTHTIVGCLLTVTVLVPMVGGYASADDGDLGGRLRAACLRIPPIKEQMNLRIAHLEGAADLKGSLAWLQVQIDRATATNHVVLAVDLQRRRDFLAAKLVLLKGRLGVVDKVVQKCHSKGIEV